MKKNPFFSDDYSSFTNVKSKVLDTMDEYKRFLNYYNRFHEVIVEVDYLLTSSVVRVFYVEEEQWLAGYVINAVRPMRYFDFFDANAKKIIVRDSGLDESKMTEITCIWIDSKLTKMNSSVRLFVYYNSVWDAAQIGHEYIIGGSVVLTVWRTFQIVLPHTLYFGLVPVAEKYIMGKIVYNKAQDALSRFDTYIQDKFNRL